MADLGHDVLAMDVDAEGIRESGSGLRCRSSSQAWSPLLLKNLDAGRLRFTTCGAEAAGFGDVHFLCVGTPQAADGGGQPELPSTLPWTRWPRVLPAAA